MAANASVSAREYDIVVPSISPRIPTCEIQCRPETRGYSCLFYAFAGAFADVTSMSLRVRVVLYIPFPHRSIAVLILFI